MFGRWTALDERRRRATAGGSEASPTIDRPRVLAGRAVFVGFVTLSVVLIACSEGERRIAIGAGETDNDAGAVPPARFDAPEDGGDASPSTRDASGSPFAMCIATECPYPYSTCSTTGTNTVYACGTNVLTDRNHCGACGNVCPQSSAFPDLNMDTQCVDGACQRQCVPRNGVEFGDCNGLVDDGTSLCPASQVCDHGTCVPSCTATSCPTGKACSTRGTCVEPACATTACAADQVCTAGTCREACSDVVCPSGQICQGDRCVDPCAGVTCANSEICDRGVCRRRCDCLPCESGLACNATSGACVEPACATVSCTAGAVCRAGTCVDACKDVKCPPDQVCASGQCAAPSAPDAGADAGAADAGSTADASVPPGPNAGDAGDEDVAAPIDDAGCTCGTPGHSSSYGLAGAWAAIATAAIAAVRRRRARMHAR